MPNNINSSSWGKWLNIYQLSFWQSKFIEALFACSVQYNGPLETNTKLKSLPDVWHCTQAWQRQTSWFSLSYTFNYWSKMHYFRFLVRLFFKAGAPGSLLISNLRSECCIKTACKWHAGGVIENKPYSQILLSPVDLCRVTELRENQTSLLAAFSILHLPAVWTGMEKGLRIKNGDD